MKSSLLLYCLLLSFVVVSCDDSYTDDHSNSIYNFHINEVMADNETTIMDNNEKYEDWIEIYNSSIKPLSLGGLFLTDGKTEWEIQESDSTIVPANGFLILWADDDVEEGVLHCNFKLSKSGEKLELYAKDEGKIIDIDEIEFDSLGTDKSYGRLVDGNEEFGILTEPTPGSPNK